MYLQIFALTIALPLVCQARATEQIVINYNSNGACEKDNSTVRPKWADEDSRNLIPLNPIVRTGEVDPLVEQGIISLAGPRFYNGLVEGDLDGDAHGEDLKCILKCAGTVVKVVPCIYEAIASNDPSKILRCASKDQVCSCLKCLPGPVRKFVAQWCSQSSIDHAPQYSTKDLTDIVVNFADLGPSSVLVAGFRGDLNAFNKDSLDNINFCPFPRCSDGCCCAGICVPGDSCLGYCLPL